MIKLIAPALMCLVLVFMGVTKAHSKQYAKYEIGAQNDTELISSLFDNDSTSKKDKKKDKKKKDKKKK